MSNTATAARQERIQLACNRNGIVVTAKKDGAFIGYKSEWGTDYLAVVILTGRMRKPLILAAFGLPVDAYLKSYNVAA